MAQMSKVWDETEEWYVVKWIIFFWADFGFKVTCTVVAKVANDHDIKTAILLYCGSCFHKCSAGAKKAKQLPVAS